MTHTVTAWSLHMPWPKPPLSLNQRGHWAKFAATKRQIRDDTLTMARAVKLPTGLDRVRIVLTWVPPDRRRRDTDNMTATLKPAIDALVAYGLVADDDAQHVQSGCVITAPPAPPMRPGVWIEITDLTEAKESA